MESDFDVCAVWSLNPARIKTLCEGESYIQGGCDRGARLAEKRELTLCGSDDIRSLQSKLGRSPLPTSSFQNCPDCKSDAVDGGRTSDSNSAFKCGSESQLPIDRLSFLCGLKSSAADQK